ncbi:MAG: YihY/virulence factor BrkB family protein [Eubacteriales bacterium]|nr:YihY/virulence factor BrkB family protein [Eubacteriales bacterium]
MKRFSKYKDFYLRFMGKMKKDRVDAFAAQSALFIIMGFFPFVMLLLTLIQYTPLTSDMVMELLVEMLPTSFYDVIAGIVEELFTSSTVLLSGTVVAALWAAGRSILSITNGLNSVRGVQENRNYLYMRLRSGIYILFLLLAIIMATILLLFGNRIQNLLLQYVPVLAKFTGMIISIRAVISILVLSLVFWAMYCSLPNCKVNAIRQIPGAVFTASAWSIYSYGFSVYFDYAGKRSSVYGSLTTVVMIMLWLYFCMWLLFVGAEVNCFLEYPDAFAGEDLL